MINKCYIGDCRDILRDMAAAGTRVQMCVTSPPYWGLRDYGIESSVWGGLPDCAHVWGDNINIHKGGPTGDTSGLTNRGANQARTRVADIRAGRFCQLCGAWVGTLGLEPDYRMYVEHIVEVMDLVREVLADDGTLWLNMGDSYQSGDRGKNPNQRAWTSKVQQSNLAGDFLASPNRLKQVGLKPKDLCMMPARVAIALQEAGWWVRQDIIWNKPNPMPESVTDRCTKAHEYIFLLSKSQRYYYDPEAIKEPASEDTHARYARTRNPSDYPGNQTIASSFEHMNKKPVSGWDTGLGSHSTLEHNRPGVHPKAASMPLGRGVRANESFSAAVVDVVESRNKRSVWTIPTEPYPDAHFATFPRKLIEPCVLAGSRKGDVVLDPFMGSGTTAQVAEHLGRQWIGCELNPEYVALQANRLRQQNLDITVDINRTDELMVDKPE